MSGFWKLVAIGTVTAALAMTWAGLWRVAFLRRCAREADQRITRNRAKRRQGMETMDEQLRDRTTARRRRDERAIENLVRELRNGRVRLRQVS